MKRKFAVFDIDGTIFRWQLFHEVAFELIQLGGLPETIREKVAEPLADWHRRAHRDSYRAYERALFESVLQHSKGISGELFDKAAKIVMERSGERVYTYSRDLLKELRSKGYILFAVSGSFAEVVSLFAQQYGFDDWEAVQFERKDGVTTGEVNFAHNRKGEILRELVAKHDLTWEGSIGVGDTASDIMMLELVEQPIAFNPNHALFEHAIQHHWKIVVERKNVIYQLQPDEKHAYQLIL